MENSSLPKNIVISKADSGDYFFYLFNRLNKDIVYNFKIKKSSTANLFFYVFSSENHQKYTINVSHQENTNSNSVVNIFTTNKGQVSLQFNTIVPKKVFSVKSSQKIEGILFSEKSSIDLLPSMFVESNKSITSHSVNIGMIDPEKIFYLESKGIPKPTAISMILKSIFYELSAAKSRPVKCLYNKVMEKFNSFVK